MPSVLLLLLLFCACTKNNEWTASTLKSGSKTFDSAKLSHFSKNDSHRLNLEMLFVQGQIHPYFHVDSKTIPPYQENSKQALLTFVVDNTTYCDVVHRHEGGQKISLSDKMEKILLTSLKEKLPVTVRLGTLETIITAEKFTDYYDRFKPSY